MTERASITIRTDKEVKDEATKVFGLAGLSFNAGIDVYLRAVARDKRIPFDLFGPPTNGNSSGS